MAHRLERTTLFHKQFKKIKKIRDGNQYFKVAYPLLTIRSLLGAIF